jgi:diguanylate cyclase (GGDEF)-like protein/PAS domain S-box-containing protein
MSNILVSVPDTAHTVPTNDDFFRKIVELLPEMVIVLNESGQVSYACPDFLAKFGYHAASFGDVKWSSFVHPDDYAYFKKISGHILSHPRKKIRVEYRFKDSDDVWHWLSGVASNELHTDSLKGVVLYIEDVTTEKETAKALLEIEYYNNNAGVVSQTLFNDRLKYALSSAARHEQKLGVIFIDIDIRQTTLPTIDSTTNAVILGEIGDRILSCLRQTDTVSTWERDKFAVIFTDIRTVQSVITVLNKVMRKIAQPVFIGANSVQIKPCMGVALYPDDVVNGENLIIYADMALQVAKLQGGNRFCFYNDQIHALYEEQIVHNVLKS